MLTDLKPQLIFDITLSMSHLPKQLLMHNYTIEQTVSQLHEMPKYAFLELLQLSFINFSWMAFTNVSNLHVLVIYLGEVIAISYLHHNWFILQSRWIMLCNFGFHHLSNIGYTIILLYYTTKCNKLITLIRKLKKKVEIWCNRLLQVRACCIM